MKITRQHEEKLSRTQELTAVKEQALKELGYTTLTEENGKDPRYPSAGQCTNAYYIHTIKDSSYNLHISI